MHLSITLLVTAFYTGVSRNFVYKPGGQIENIDKKYNYLGKHGRKSITAAVRELSESAHVASSM